MRGLAAAQPAAWGGAYLLPLALRLLVFSGYQQYLLDLIVTNIVLTVGLNTVKGFAV
jgi:hypothetical protein